MKKYYFLKILDKLYLSSAVIAVAVLSFQFYDNVKERYDNYQYVKTKLEPELARKTKELKEIEKVDSKNYISKEEEIIEEDTLKNDDQYQIKLIFFNELFHYLKSLSLCLLSFFVFRKWIIWIFKHD